MFGVLLLLVYMGMGVTVGLRVFAACPRSVRIWAGAVLGLLAMMWAPVPFAFLFGFGYASQGLAFALALGLTAYVHIRVPKPILAADDTRFVRMWLWTCAPLFVVTLVLMITHYYLPGADGWYVGQSTYGDLNLHAGIAQAVAVQRGVFPIDYPIFPGARLGYPFLADTLASSMLLLGASLQASLVWSGALCALLLFGGYFVFAHEVTQSRKSAVFSTVLLFLNGGLGFIYFFDKTGGWQEMMNGFYTTPTNYAAGNIRWVNLICDMIIPQRTFLFGWCILMLALWLLYRATQQRQKRAYIAAGVVAGLLPLIHTHSFLALVLVALAWALYDWATTKDFRRTLATWLPFALPTLLLALPQILFFTLPQSALGPRFLGLHWNWANEGDNYVWFYIKNIGVPILVLLPALLWSGKKLRRLAWAALPIWILAECIRFQPNPYDNNKLLYVAYALVLPIVASYLLALYRRLAGLKGRRVVAALLVALCTCSAVLSIGREAVSRYSIFSSADVAAAEFVRTKTATDAVFLTADNHTNPITPLSGRSIYCGTDVYLHFHGVATAPRKALVEELFANAETLANVAGRNGIDYVYISPAEVSAYGQRAVDDLLARFKSVYSAGGITILAVSERAVKAAL